MQLTRRPLLAMGVAMALGAGAGYANATTSFLGDWFGSLDLGSRRLHLRLVVSEGPRAILYSIDQGNSPIPAGETRIEGDRIFISWPAIGASYAGQLTGNAIVGQFMQGGVLPLNFSRTQDTQSIVRPEPLTQGLLAKLRSECGAPALAAASWNRIGRRVAFVDGMRAIGRGNAVTTADKWHIGSCTKSMTATLVARAVDAGLIGWNDTVWQTLGRVVPEMQPEYRDITYRHLLSHRSGMAANIDVPELVKFPRESADARADRAAYARLALSRAPAGRKETHFEYSNSGYAVVGAMLEARLAAPWEKLIHDHVFLPLKMTSAGFGAPGTPGAYDQPVGHTANAVGTLEPYPPGAPVTDNPAVLGPAGRVHAALDDVLRYLNEHCTKSSFLREASWKMLHTPPFGGKYAMGWERRDKLLWHTGSNTLWYCEMAVDLARGIVSVAATNDGRMATVSVPVSKAQASAAEAVA